MNILVLGNGFDIAHGLPTRYKDFLELMTVLRSWATPEFDETLEAAPDHLQAYLQDFSDHLHKDVLIRCSTTNFWVQHFFEQQQIPEQWVDFESEILRVIQSLNFIKNQHSPEESTHEYIALRDNMLREIDDSYKHILRPHNRFPSFALYFATLIDFLERQLDELVEGLSVYLGNCVRFLAPKRLPLFDALRFDKVLNFNYTATYQTLYREDIDVDFIHGKIDPDHVTKSTMILGIDEYLSPQERTLDTAFLSFQKYFQRIHKKTGCKYKHWLLPAEYRPFMHIMFFGHSLGLADKDVLSELLTFEDAQITIFNHDTLSYKAQLANLIGILGPQALIGYTYSANPKIRFVNYNDSSELQDLMKHIQETERIQSFL